ncbi:MAG: MFS transporter [Gammaproteobacteria bacterium]|nr:MFS transporter [Gammaproteobacteria bacterium]
MTEHARRRLSLAFSAAGHATMHLLTAFFFVIVLALENEWHRPYHELIELWTIGALLVGVVAVPVGWITDRWHAPGMLTIMFLGLGVSCLGCALADGSVSLWWGLTALGVFAGIYHPVGIPWVVRTSQASGKALGLNGIFGGFGVAAAGGLTGFLTDQFGWQAAFAVPGVVCLLIGIALGISTLRGWVDDGDRNIRRTQHSRGDMLRSFAMLAVTMFCLGFIYQASQTAFPKVFDVRLEHWLGEGTLGVGMIVTMVYGVAAVMQLVGGHLADHYPLKRVYLGAILIQTPVLVFLILAAGLPLIAAATLSVLLSTAALPSENMLLARITPQKHVNLAFGVKFILAFGAAPAAIAFVAWINGTTGGFEWVFGTMAILAAISAMAAMALPGDRPLEEQTSSA